MKIVAFGLSGAAALFLIPTIFVGSKELSLLQFSQLSAARQFGQLSRNEIEPAFSQLSEFIVLKACRDAMTRIMGRLQPATRRGRVAETWLETRKRILRETGNYLTLCLERPEMGVVIPTVRAGRGRFAAERAVAFWTRVLSSR